MANKKNKVKFGLTNVHYAKIKDWVTDASGANLTPVYVDPVRLPGAVSISIDANGENENFYADDIVYYVISNNSGYEGDLEIALIPTDFSTDILGEILDSNGVLVERNDDEVSQFALLFEFTGDKRSLLLFRLPSGNRGTDHRGQQGSKNRNHFYQSFGFAERSGKGKDM